MDVKGFAKQQAKQAVKKAAVKVILSNPIVLLVIGLLILVIVVVSSITAMPFEKEEFDNSVKYEIVEKMAEANDTAHCVDESGNSLNGFKDYYNQDTMFKTPPSLIKALGGFISDNLNVDATEENAASTNHYVSEEDIEKVLQAEEPIFKYKVATIITKVNAPVRYTGSEPVDTDGDGKYDSTSTYEYWVQEDLPPTYENIYLLSYTDGLKGEYTFTYTNKEMPPVVAQVEHGTTTTVVTKPVLENMTMGTKTEDKINKILKTLNPNETYTDNTTAFMVASQANQYEKVHLNNSLVDDQKYAGEDIDELTTMDPEKDFLFTGGGTFTGTGVEFSGDRKAFVEAIAPAAIETYKKYQVLPSLTIAQAILESASGKSGLTKKGNALFGIKADSRWTGQYVVFLTNEWYGGIKQVVSAKFRAYASWAESVEDHGKFLWDNPRYREHGVLDAKTAAEACVRIQQAGYATDPKYAELLMSLIIDGNLAQYDSMALSGASL